MPHYKTKKVKTQVFGNEVVVIPLEKVDSILVSEALESFSVNLSKKLPKKIVEMSKLYIL